MLKRCLSRLSAPTLLDLVLWVLAGLVAAALMIEFFQWIAHP